jgi:plasmid stabilization system protein ParE
MSYRVRFARGAVEDLQRLYDFILERDRDDLALADRARSAIRNAVAVTQTTPFSCRKADGEDPFLRELVIPFGVAGYVELFEIESDSLVTILAVRHQRESDYY